MNDVVDTPASSDTYRVTSAELRAFVERYERLEAEKKDLMDQMKEVMAEAKGRGYDVKALRKLISLRKLDPAQVSEEEAVLELYKDALGM
jgi:uncharacterized protein (UPF0335 family)